MYLCAVFHVVKYLIEIGPKYTGDTALNTVVHCPQACSVVLYLIEIGPGRVGPVHTEHPVYRTCKPEYTEVVLYLIEIQIPSMYTTRVHVFKKYLCDNRQLSTKQHFFSWLKLVCV